MWSSRCEDSCAASKSDVRWVAQQVAARLNARVTTTKRATHERLAAAPAPDPDQRLLQRPAWPDPSEAQRAIRIVDLFAGAGGMSLGAFLATKALRRRFEVALAIEGSAEIAKIYESNLGRFVTETGFVHSGSIEELIDGELGSDDLTEQELALATGCGNVDLLVGGPPCQGNSDFNNHTRRDDVRNPLYERMARAAEVLRPAAVLIENVPPVVHDRGGVVERAEDALRHAGYVTCHTVLSFDRLGVPQRRRRHLLIGIRDADQGCVDSLGECLRSEDLGLYRPVSWAIGDLEGKAEPPGSGGFDAPPDPSQDNAKRLAWFQRNSEEINLPNKERPPCHRNGGHSYKSIYGRMQWNEPAQTMTTGFGSMGQGRYVHPSEERTITPHEAARLQTFPDFFSFATTKKRTVWARAIGNAVPPIGMREVVKLVVGAIEKSRHA